MARYKIIYLLLLTYSIHAEERPKTPAKQVLRQSEPYSQKEPSFMSRITSWIFPFNSNAPDTISAETNHRHQYSGNQYLPPPPQSDPNCNPCNREPWIPVASNIGHNTVINFIQPSNNYAGGNLRLYPSPPLQHKPFQFKPVPQKSHYGLPLRSHHQNSVAAESSLIKDYMVPPPFRPLKNYIQPHYHHKSAVTHLNPVIHAQNLPIDMKPPPYNQNGFVSDNFNQYLPVVPPSDSYGLPLDSNILNNYPKVNSLDYSSSGEQQQSISTNIVNVNRPIPLPNLNTGPVLPIHDYNYDFHNNGSPQETKVEIVPSIKVADYLSSVEHPINVIQSPLVEVSVNEKNNVFDEINPIKSDAKLSDNPIIVDDTHTAASNAINISYYQNADNNHRGNDDDLFENDSRDAIPEETSRSQSTNLNQINLNQIREILKKENILPPSVVSKELNVNQTVLFTPSPVDYSGKWQPSWGSSVATSMMPPPPSIGQSASTWLVPVKSTTKKPGKHLQIIIPYINNKRPLPFNYHPNQERKITKSTAAYSTLLPVYTPPPSTSEESIWMKFIDDFKLAESKRVTATAFSIPSTTTAVSNIRDLINAHDPHDDHRSSADDKLPFDVISLQNNIDDWTQQEYSSSKHHSFVNPAARKLPQSTTQSKLVPSKQIPNEYFTTQPYYNEGEVMSTTIASQHQIDYYEPAGSKIVEEKDIESNLIFSETTTELTTTSSSPLTTTTTEKASTTSVASSFLSRKEEQKKSLWDIALVTVSPITKEKVYIVTPQPTATTTTTPRTTAWSLPPQIQDGQIRNESNAKFLIRVEPENRDSRELFSKSDKNDSLTIVFSEWPHLINNLQTTTMKPTSRHPLFGLMEIPYYSPPPNSTVQTILGHSKVAAASTPASSVSDQKQNTLDGNK